VFHPLLARQTKIKAGFHPRRRAARGNLMLLEWDYVKFYVAAAQFGAMHSDGYLAGCGGFSDLTV